MRAVYFGHHKCASSWITDIMCDLARIARRRFVCARDPDSFAAIADRLGTRDVLVCANAEPEYRERLSEYRGFHVIRDPRDVVVSAYFSHLYSHPDAEWLTPIRTALRAMSTHAGLMFEIQECGWVFGCMSRWNYGGKDVLELRMEDVVVAEPELPLIRALQFLGLATDDTSVRKSEVSAASSVDRKMCAEVLHRHRFAAKSGGREPGVEDLCSHYRKGVAGGWRRHLAEDHKRYFKQLYPGLVAQL